MISSPTISDREFSAFQKLIHDLAGISMADAKKALLVGRLSKRLRHHGLNTFDQYYRHITAGGDKQEFQLMVDLLTTNETYFFRESRHFDFLRKLAQSHPKDRPFNVWSGASSSGEEIYTICMVLADIMGIGGNWTVLGSDINRSVLKVAEAGRYAMATTRGLPPEYLRKYCVKGAAETEGTFVVDPRLRAHATFRQINLNTTLPDMGPFDVVFLRNVMIYFDINTKREVVARIAQKLKPGGHFIIGHAETLTGIHEALHCLQPTIFRNTEPSAISI